MQPRYRIPNSNGASTSAPTFWNLLNQNGEEDVFSSYNQHNFFLSPTVQLWFLLYYITITVNWREFSWPISFRTLCICICLYYITIKGLSLQLDRILLTHFPQDFVYLCMCMSVLLQLSPFHYNWTKFSWPISFSTWEFWKLFCCFKTCSVLLSVSAVKL